MKDRMVGHYRIEQEIGQGGMGVVYRAYDTKLERTVALKSVSQKLAQEDEARQRILKEAKTAASLDHPYVCKVFDAVEGGGQLYVVMEYIEGQTLEGLELGLQEAIRIGSEIAEALEEAHSKGIVHRDLKPSNVMRTRSGHIKIMDFGLAKILQKHGEPGAAQDLTASAGLTGTGQILGSTPYMSPEQLRRQTVDARSDVFAFGVLMYELITGHRPFYGSTTVETCASILSDESEPMARYRRGVPDKLEQIVRKMLAKNPAERYQSAAEIRHELERLAQPQSPGHSANIPLWVKGMLFATGLLVIGISILVWYFRPTIELARPGSERISSLPESNQDIDVLYQRAKLLSLRLSHSDNQQAIGLLEECIRRAPDHVRAHSALALEILKRFWWYQGDPGLLEEALEHAAQALKRDPRLVEARAIQAIGKTLRSGDPQGYLDLAQCLQAEPGQPEALAWLALFFAKAGEFTPSQKLIDRLKRDHPNSPWVRPVNAYLFIQKQDFASAEKQIKELELAFPNWEGATYDRALIAIKLQRSEMLEKAIAEMRLIHADDPSIRFYQSYLKAMQGSVLISQDLENLVAFLPQDYELAALFAQICARVGDAEKALQWLKYSIEKGNYDIIQLKHPDFQILAGDPRFESLKTSLQRKISNLTGQIEPLVLSKKGFR